MTTNGVRFFVCMNVEWKRFKMLTKKLRNRQQAGEVMENFERMLA